MSESITVRGTVLADGSLHVEGPLALPPGPVEVVVRPEQRALPPQDVLAVLQRIWDEQNACGRPPRSAEEIDAEIQQMRDEWDERDREIEALQEEGAIRRASGTPSGTTS
jgi:hypothetical protein